MTNLGDGITPAASPLLVASVTRDALAVAILVLLTTLIVTRHVDITVVLADARG